MQSNPFYVRCYARREADQWVAVCIDLGLAVQGNTCAEVKAKLEIQVSDYVHDALTVDRVHAADLLRRKAPFRQRAEYHAIRLWQVFFGQRVARTRQAFEELIAVPA